MSTCIVTGIRMCMRLIESDSLKTNNKKARLIHRLLDIELAEREGFEPSIRY